MKKTKLIVIAALVLSLLGSTCVVAEAAENRTTCAPSGISVTKSGVMYMSDRNYHILRTRDVDGKIETLAGTEGESGYKDGSAKEAMFHSPWDVVSYKNGLAISDTENHVIRVMDKKGKVSVFAGSKKGCAGGKVKNARFCEPTGLFYYKGALYVADSGNHRICKIKDGKVATITGSSKGIEGSSVGKASKACLSNPQEICWANGKMYIADTGNGAVKLLQNGKVSEIVKAYSLSEGTAPVEPCGLMIKGKYLFVGDMFTEKLLKIEL